MRKNLKGPKIIDFLNAHHIKNLRANGHKVIQDDAGKNLKFIFKLISGLKSYISKRVTLKQIDLTTKHALSFITAQYLLVIRKIRQKLNHLKSIQLRLLNAIVKRGTEVIQYKLKI